MTRTSLAPALLCVLLAACAPGAGSSGSTGSAGGGGDGGSMVPGTGGATAAPSGGGWDGDGGQGGRGAGGAATSSSSGTQEVDDFEAGGARPVTVRVPTGHDGSPAPLLLVLHGYASTGALAEVYFALGDAAEAEGVIVAAPDGLMDAAFSRYWNGTAACCDYYASQPDDVGYLRDLVDEIASRIAVDPKRVFVLGHSNGGFMAYRTACDAASTFAAVVSLSGATENDPADCAPSEPVSVLEIHGTADSVVAYAGGFIGLEPFPSAPTTAGTWAAHDGCDPEPETDPTVADVVLPTGADTTVERWSGCAGGSGVELWSVQGGIHQPLLAPDFGAQVLAFLLAHPKP